MTKQHYVDLANYNSWANNIVFNWLTEITEAQWNQPIVSSFESIAATALHIASAEKAWLERFEQKPFTWLASSFIGSKEGLLEIWKKASIDLKSFVDKFDEKDLEQTLTFKRLNGEENTMPFYQMFAHVFNHSTYHRGQLVTMLRQVGFTNVGSTDILSYYRK
jgi:uncharacterized damage-inducible protein DinB